MTGLRGEKRTQLRQRGGIQSQQQQKQQWRGRGAATLTQHRRQMRNVSEGTWPCLLSCRQSKIKVVFCYFFNAGTEGRATLFDRLLGDQPRAKTSLWNKPDLVPKVRPESHNTFVLGQKYLLLPNVGSKTVRRGVRSRSASCQEWKCWQQTLITS